MNNRYTLRDLIEKIAQASGISSRHADAFMRAFIETVVEGLERENIVKIKHVGTFKLVTVNERASIDVNTGESIQIESHKKISFTPDEHLKEVVNKPFALFQTIVVEDDVDSDALNAIGEDETEDIPEETNVETEDANVEAEEVTAATEVPTEGTANEAEEAIEISEEPINTAFVAEDSTEQVAEEPKEEVPTSEETTETEEKPTATEDIQTITSHLKEEKVKVVEKPVAIASESVEEESETTEPADETEEKAHVNPWKIATIVLAAILIALLGYWAGYHRVFLSDNNQDTTAVKVAETDVTANDSVNESDSLDSLNVMSDVDSTASATTKNVSPEKKVTPYKRPVTTTQRSKTLDLPVRNLHQVQPGETLYMIAEREYGRKDYAKYIIEYNGISNPDIIEKGSILKIPEIVK